MPGGEDNILTFEAFNIGQIDFDSVRDTYL